VSHRIARTALPRETAGMSEPVDLARQVDAAQSILATPAAAEARRLERALATTSSHVAAAMARLDPASGAAALALAGGTAIFAGRGSPLTQGLAMGLDGPVTAAELDAVEAHLRPDGRGAVQLELCPFADPTLSAELARRGYRVHEWQLVWTRPLAQETLAPPPPELRIARVEPGQEELFFHVVAAGFLETEEVPPEAIALFRPTAFATDHEQYLAWLGDEAIGGGALAFCDDVAFISGSGVRPAFRRRGAQGALIRARLARAAAFGCTIATSSTLPGTASRRNMERHGFSVAYPKLLMLKDDAS
jgi:GNAT superfamily N-acetyltransferase